MSARGKILKEENESRECELALRRLPISGPKNNCLQRLEEQISQARRSGVRACILVFAIAHL